MLPTNCLMLISLDPAALPHQTACTQPQPGYRHPVLTHCSGAPGSTPVTSAALLPMMCSVWRPWPKLASAPGPQEALLLVLPPLPRPGLPGMCSKYCSNTTNCANVQEVGSRKDACSAQAVSGEGVTSRQLPGPQEELSCYNASDACSCSGAYLLYSAAQLQQKHVKSRCQARL